ncbi:MAG: hypothetical protein GY733_22410 [bacterium]|nr:hypothetical protein [bacterium]
MSSAPLEAVLSRLTRPKKSGTGWSACCPAHEDRRPSLSVAVGEDGRVLLACHAGCTADAICAALSIPISELFPRRVPWWGGGRSPLDHRRSARTPDGLPSSFGPEDARALWRLARARAHDDEQIDDDAVVYEYVRRRGIEESWEVPGFGVLGRGIALPESVSWWPRNGYRLVAPLYDASGTIINVQARCIAGGASKKVLVPKRSRCKATVFANAQGRSLLRGDVVGKDVLLVEGMTDFFAAGIASNVAVLGVPGTGAAESAVGSWASGCRVFIAMDLDQAGEASVSRVAQELAREKAESAYRLVWPRGCTDVCDVMASIGSTGLADFLEDSMTEARHERVA